MEETLPKLRTHYQIMQTFTCICLFDELLELCIDFLLPNRASWFYFPGRLSLWLRKQIWNVFSQRLYFVAYALRSTMMVVWLLYWVVNDLSRALIVVLIRKGVAKVGSGNYSWLVNLFHHLRFLRASILRKVLIKTFTCSVRNLIIIFLFWKRKLFHACASLVARSRQILGINILR